MNLRESFEHSSTRFSLSRAALASAACACALASFVCACGIDTTSTSGDPSASNGGGGSGANGGGSGAGGGDGWGSFTDGGSASDSGVVPTPSDARIVGYFTAWSVYARSFNVSDIAADKITHVNYAFANVSDTGECVLGDSYADIDKAYPGDTWDPGVLRGSFHQLQILKKAHPKLKTIISIGGWTWSAHFSDAAASDASRTHFAQSCVKFMKQYGFDGVDIDWEYPVSGGLQSGRPEDKANYTLLLGALRHELDAQGAADGGAHYLLTIAAPAGPGTYANLELASVAAKVDWVNLMSYDFHGGWEKTTNFNAPLFASANDPSADPLVKTKFNTSSAVDGYLAGGVPAGKIVMGVPFYGRGWSGVASANDGLYQTSASLPQGTWEQGVFDYKDIAKNYATKYARHWHSEAQVPWLYDAASQTMISYDDAQSIALKAKYAKQKGLGGVMFWELSGDDGTLLDAVRSNL